MPDPHRPAQRTLVVALALLAIAAATGSTTTYLAAALAGLTCSAIATCTLIAAQVSSG